MSKCIQACVKNYESYLREITEKNAYGIIDTKQFRDYILDILYRFFFFKLCVLIMFAYSKKKKDFLEAMHSMFYVRACTEWTPIRSTSRTIHVLEMLK